MSEVASHREPSFMVGAHSDNFARLSAELTAKPGPMDKGFRTRLMTDFLRADYMLA